MDTKTSIELTIVNTLSAWGYGETNAPLFVTKQAETIARCYGMRTGEIIVELGLADKQTVDRHLANQPSNVMTVEYLAGKIDGVGPNRQRILAVNDGLMYWESDLSTGMIVPEVSSDVEAMRFCSQKHCAAWTHPIEADTVMIGFSDHHTLDTFSRMGRADAAKNPLLRAIGDRRVIKVLASMNDINLALQDGVEQESKSMGNDSDKSYWSWQMAETDAQSALVSIFNEAIELGGTDIGLIPHLDGTSTVTIRRHGDIAACEAIPKLQYAEAQGAIRFLLMRSGADPTSQRLTEPKDGALKYSSPNTEAHMRLNFIPMDVMGANHEMISVSIRVLALKTIRIQLTDLNIDAELIADIHDIIKEDKGLLLISAPVNNGKSTTVGGINQAHIDTYGVLGRRRLSVEQPVERLQEGVISFSIERSSLYAMYTKAKFRHDLDYGFIGEVRDPQAAAAFVRLGTSGHMGLSTTHAKDCIAAISVVLNYIKGFDASKDDALYVQPNDFIDNLSLSIAQRLVPHLCSCAEDHEVTDTDIAGLQRHERKNGHKAFSAQFVGKTVKSKKAGGCKICKGTGTRGELPIVEWLIVTEAMKEQMLQQIHERNYVDTAILRTHRKKSLYESAVNRALAGEIGIESLYV